MIVLASLGSLSYNIIARRRFRAAGTDLPQYLVGNVSVGIGMILLSGFYLLGAAGPLATISLFAALACLALGIAQGVHARRRRS